MIVRGVIENRKLLSAIYMQDFARTGARLTELRGLFDTGATRTLVTSNAVRASGLVPEGTLDVRGVNSAAHLAAVALQVGFMPEEGIAPYVLDAPLRAAVNRPPTDPNAADSYDVLIGMDVIERGVLTVDGPAGTFAFEVR